jgi:hypothetical protein
MAKRGFPVAEKPYDGTPPKPGAALGAPAQTSLEDLMGDGLAPIPPEGDGVVGVSPQEPPAAPEPLVRLPTEVFREPAVPAGAFSDDPPEGWGSGEGNVLAEDPVTSQLDPVAAARASLLEDAARASGGAAPASAPTSIPVQRGSRVPEIRQALARAAAMPDARRYRSRITVGAAYQFDGRLHVAPAWVSREWAAYEDGPAINVPEVGIVKAGQWIVSQDVLDDDGGVSYSEIKVYDDGVFRSLFMVEAGND